MPFSRYLTKGASTVERDICDDLCETLRLIERHTRKCLPANLVGEMFELGQLG